MTACHGNYCWVRFWIAAVAWLSLGWSVGSTAELDKLDTSLKLIPADAAFYSSMMRNGEQFEILRRSKAWAKVEAMPVVQMGLMMYQMQLDVPGSGPAKLKLALDNPEVRKITDMAVDMVSDEIFIYGDDSCIDFLQLAQDIGRAMNYGPIVMQATGEADVRDPGQIQTKVMISTLAKNVDLIGMPNFVVGFKIKNAKLVQEQLIKLETFGDLLESNEKTKGCLKKTKVGGNDFLVLELNGAMAPWDELPMDKLHNMELEEGDVDTIIEKLKESKLVIAIGLRGDFLLCSVGSSVECLEKLGRGDRLIDAEAFKPLALFVDRRLTSIGYIGEDMNRQLNNQTKQIDDLLKLADKLLPLAKLSDEKNEKIKADIEKMAQDVKGLIPEVGATMGLQFLSDQGVEAFHYAWGKFGRIDGSRPLGLLQHVGGNPIFGVVARAKMSVEDYDMMVNWVKTAYGYFEELALPQIPEEDREKIAQLLESALPLVARMDKANREKLIPALADGQSALVVDAKMQSKQYHAAMPAAENPMPMIEPALVFGIGDAKLFEQGLGEYKEVINGLIDAVRQIEGTDVPPEIGIPKPQKTKSPQGTTYSFPLPAEWGVDKQIVPNVGITADAAVFSMSPAQTERILKATPPAIGGVLNESETDRSLAIAAWFDWARLVDVATPWIDFAITQTANERGIDASQQKPILDQVHTGLEVLKTLRSITSECYLEEGILVTHSLLEIRDVEK